MAKKKRKAKGKGGKRRRVVKKGRTLKRKISRRRVTPKKGKKSGKRVVKEPELPSKPIGKVTHYFPKAHATAVILEREGLRVGDTLYFKGHTTRFKQQVESIQIDRRPVSEASSGEEVGIQVRSRTREHDLVFKL